MMFRFAALAFLASTVSAFKGGIGIDTPAGRKLMDSATVVEPARRLNQDRDESFIAKYYIKYTGCSDLVQIQPEGGGDEGLLYTQHLVKFSLCSSCGSCSDGGQYVVDMMEFVDAYTEAKLTEQEYKCEMIRENCYCNGYNDDEQCENNCYMQAGMEVCIEYEGQEEFEIQRYLECAELENQNGNNNNNGQNYYQNGNNNNFYGQYYIAPFCARDGESINLGVFYDEQCMNRASSSVYADYNYGQSLPFSSESIVTVGDCISCEEIDQDNNNNYNQNQNQNQNGNYYYEEDLEATELCARSYEEAARCEKSMSISYPDSSGCTFINDILPRMESASSKISSGGKIGSGNGPARAFAWIFGITTILFGAYAYFLYRKIKRGSVNLSSQEGALA